MTARLAVELPPHGTDKDLTDYLVRMFNSTDIAFIKTTDYSPVHILPAKPQEGMVRYFGSILGGDITAIGLYVYKNTKSWVLLG